MNQYPKKSLTLRKKLRDNENMRKSHSEDLFDVVFPDVVFFRQNANGEVRRFDEMR
jgi:hypothetical protein